MVGRFSTYVLHQSSIMMSLTHWIQTQTDNLPQWTGRFSMLTMPRSCQVHYTYCISFRCCMYPKLIEVACLGHSVSRPVMSKYTASIGTVATHSVLIATIVQFEFFFNVDWSSDRDYPTRAAVTSPLAMRLDSWGCRAAVVVWGTRICRFLSLDFFCYLALCLLPVFIRHSTNIHFS